MDKGFGLNGKLVVGTEEKREFFLHVALQNDDKMLVLGYKDERIEKGFLLARYYSDGLIDTTFGINGKIITEFDANNYYPTQVITSQSDEKILILGDISLNGAKKDIAIARYYNNGVLDESFGIGGKVATELTDNTSVIFQSDDEAYNMFVESNGKIIIAGKTYEFADATKGHQFLVRYYPNGVLDDSFGTGGKVIEKTLEKWSMAKMILKQTTNKIIVGGTSWNEGSFSIKLTSS